MSKHKEKQQAFPDFTNNDACQIDRERYRVFIEDVADGYYETNLNGDFVFFNEAFCRIFGFDCDEMQNRNYSEFMTGKNAKIAFESLNKVFRTGKGFTDIRWEITRKDNEIRILKISANLILNNKREKVGFRGIAHDVTREKRTARSNQALFRISKAISRYRRLNQRLEFIVKEVKDLIDVEGASVILVDEEKKEFFFPAATYDNGETGNKMKEIRFPLDKGVSGHVYQTGQPMIVPDTSKSPYFFQQVDKQSEYQTKNMLDVPIRLQDRIIGVLCAVNKKERDFDKADVFLMNTIASTVALPIENARINDKLKQSYEEVKSLNRAKDKVIHHLSHELKTPLSVLAASLSLLKKKPAEIKEGDRKRITDRMQRNLDRLLEMQYEIEDILRGRDYKSFNMLSTLMDVCADEIEALVSDNLCEKDVVEKIRNKIEQFFGPREATPKEIQLEEFSKRVIDQLRPEFSHRSCDLISDISPVASILVPPEVLEKTIAGLVRNAVENTPDGGKIKITVKSGATGPKLLIKDYGVGITKENQRLIFESNFVANEAINYASRKRFDFNAGGKGFDLLRMKIFSERYQFKIQLNSRRCRFIPRDIDLCPGNIDNCRHCQSPKDCFRSGGSTIIIRFRPFDETVSFAGDEN